MRKSARDSHIHNIPDITTIPEIPIINKISLSLWFQKVITLDVYPDIPEIINIPVIPYIPYIPTIREIPITIKGPYGNTSSSFYFPFGEMGGGG